MNREKRAKAAVKIVAGSLLGILLAFLSPFAMLTEFLSLMPVVILPTLGTMLLYRWAGFVPMLLSMILQVLFAWQFAGNALVWVVLFMTFLPVAFLLRNESRPFSFQLKSALAACFGGVFASVLILYLRCGGNLIEWFMQKLTQTARQIPEEMLETVAANMGAALGREISLEGFYGLFDEMIARLTPVYQTNMPALLFGGALITAVLTTGLNSYLLHRRKLAAEGVYLPLHRWRLSPQTTCGILMMLAVSLGAYLGGMEAGQTLFYAVYEIAIVAFCIQAFASAARFLYTSELRRGMKIFLLVVLLLICVMGASTYVALYGCASAILGRYGVLQQRIADRKSRENKPSDKEH